MKHLFLVMALAAVVLLPASCANNSSAATAATAAAAPVSSGNEGEGSLAYTIDGTRTVVKRPSSTLYLNEVSHNAANGTVKIKVTIFPKGELFHFVVADKGTTDVVHYKPSFGEEKVVAIYLSTDGHNYYGERVSIIISALDAAHVAGTFSGTFASEGKTFNITDGSFDLPMKANK